MSLITIICLAFVIGYVFIAIESVTKINKAAISPLYFLIAMLARTVKIPSTQKDIIFI